MPGYGRPTKSSNEASLARDIDLANSFNDSRKNFEAWTKSGTANHSDFSEAGKEHLQSVKDCFQRISEINLSQLHMNGTTQLHNGLSTEQQTKLLAELTASCVEFLATSGRTHLDPNGSSRANGLSHLPHLLKEMAKSNQRFLERGTSHETDSTIDLLIAQGQRINHDEQVASQALRNFRQLTRNKGSLGSRHVSQIDKAFVSSIPYFLKEYVPIFTFQASPPSEDTLRRVRAAASIFLPLTILWKDSNTSSTKHSFTTLPSHMKVALSSRNQLAATKYALALSELQTWGKQVEAGALHQKSFQNLARSIDANSPTKIRFSSSTNSWTFQPNPQASLARLTNDAIFYLIDSGEPRSKAKECPGLPHRLREVIEEFTNCRTFANEGDRGVSFANSLINSKNSSVKKKDQLDAVPAAQALKRFIDLTETQFGLSDLSEIDNEYINSVPYYLDQAISANPDAKAAENMQTAGKFLDLAIRWEDAHNYADRLPTSANDGGEAR